MEFRILGPVEVRGGDAELTRDGVKPRTVLAALLLSGDKLISDEQMSDVLWGPHPPATSYAQIHTYVSRLRKIVGSRSAIVRRSPGYRLDIGTAHFDFAEFQNEAERGRTALFSGRYEEAAKRYRAALHLWRGPALAGVTEYLASSAGPRLEEDRLSVLERRLDADLALGRAAEILPELAQLVAQHPLRERFRAQLMTVLYRCDRQADALTVFDEGRRVLAEEFGIDPGALLREVHQAILTGTPALVWPGAGPVPLVR
ncbi:DNA-binding transcriptional activator of the SARP family [Lentzea albidocapillata subsp. violacea]|uniref:DNA-binding transcriptional activator of the SARP family n=1 Tax=Lentzea albidocapillata subsp. violacea TaxID=128104 RepID=A0A1G9JJS6_9PSEU|nr:DNA-binding transcriptional activator of the SARP family [Lentzea albidocapillata subsp. violacea]